MSWQVRILSRAQADAESIFNWIATRSPAGAAQWYERFLDAARELQRNPLRYAAAPECGAMGFEVRQKLFKTRRGRLYRLLFVVVASEVRVLRVRGPGQLPIVADELTS